MASPVLRFRKKSIVLTLCVQDGKLNGIINQESVYSDAIITTTQVISKKYIIVTLNDIQGNANIFRLVTVGSKKLNGSLGNNLFAYTKKINSDGCGALVQSEDNNQPGGQEGGTSSSSSGQQGGTSPVGAINACSGKSSGNSCSFSDGGMTISGTCLTPPGQNQLSCIP